MDSNTAHMKRKLLATILLCCLFICARGNVDKAFLVEPCRNMTSEEIMKKGISLYNAHKTDSCLMFLEVLAVRGKRPALTREEAQVISRSINFMGAVYIYEYQDYYRAASMFCRAMDIAEKYGCRTAIAETLNNLTTLACQESRIIGRKDFNKEAVRQYRKVFDMASEDGYDKLAIHAALNCGLSANGDGNLARIRPMLEKASGMKGVSEPYRLQCEALMLMSDKRYDDALRCLEYARTTATGDSTLPGMFFTSLDELKAQVLTSAGREEEGMRLCRELIERCRKNDETLPAIELHGMMRDIALHRGDSATARIHEFEIYKASSKGLQNVADAIAQGKNLYQFEKFRDEITLRDAMVEEYRVRIVIISCFSVLVIGLLAALYIKFRQLKRSNHLLVKRDLEILSLENPGKAQSAQPDATSGQTPSAADADMSPTYRTVFDKVVKLFDESEEIYDESFSAVRLAELIGEKQNVVSASIRSLTGAGFGALLAEKRIKEAARRILDRENYGDYTIEAIALSVGYKSRSYFCTTFKKILGLSPKEYMNYAAKEAAAQGDSPA